MPPVRPIHPDRSRPGRSADRDHRRCLPARKQQRPIRCQRIRWSADHDDRRRECRHCADTSGLTQGTYRYFVRAVDNHSQRSGVSTTLTVTAADDYGNNAATAAVIGVPVCTRRHWRHRRCRLVPIRNGGGEGLRPRHAARHVEERRYCASTTATAPPCWPATTTAVEPRRADHWISAPASGTYYLAVAANGNTYTGTYGVSIRNRKTPPPC